MMTLNQIRHFMGCYVKFETMQDVLNKEEITGLLTGFAVYKDGSIELLFDCKYGEIYFPISDIISITILDLY